MHPQVHGTGGVSAPLECVAEVRLGNERPARKDANDEDSWRLTFEQSCWAALGLGLLVFVKDWSGYNPREPDLFFPRPIREVWWHLPAAVAFSFGALQMARSLDWAKDRPWPCWIAYVLALIALVTLGVWLAVWVGAS